MAAWTIRTKVDPDTRYALDASFDTDDLFEALDRGWEMHRTFEKTVEVVDNREGVPHVAGLIRVEWLDD